MKGSRTIYLVQARSASTRLPGKAFRPLPPDSSLSILEHSMRRLEKAGVGAVYALIPHNDGPMQSFLEQRSLSFIAGPLEDVRSRFKLAAEITGAEYIVRATADNPCIDPDFVRRSVEELESSSADLFAFSGLPLGCAVEVFRSSALTNRHRPESHDPEEYREHVSLHIKHNPEHYLVHRKSAEFDTQRTASMRLTIDEEADYLVVSEVFDRLGPDFSIYDLMDLQKKDPDLFLQNSHVHQRKFPAHLFIKRHSA